MSMAHTSPADHSSSPIRNLGPYNVPDNLYLSPIIPLDTPEIYRILNISDAISKGLYSAKKTFPFTREGSDAFTQYHVARRTTHGYVDCWAIRPAPEGPVLRLLGLHAYNHEAKGVPVCYRTSDVGSDSVHYDAQGSDTRQRKDRTMTSDPVPPPIRDRDPYKVAEDIHLSAFVPSDAPEMDRAHDISNSIFLGIQVMQCGVLGYWLSPEFSGKGVMTRAVAYALRQLAGSVFEYERVHDIA
ncbi:hypothetical protein CPB97_002353 [Podila verticillata]|nr:hypothetical protein CPB97_002353 [Podila verticillata]